METNKTIQQTGKARDLEKELEEKTGIIENVKKEEMELEKERKKRVSPTYLIRAFGVNIEKLKDLKIIDTADFEKLKEIHKRVVEKFIGGQIL